MCDEEIIEWKVEAQGVIHDVQSHVNSIKISDQLESDETEIFLNLETKEGERFCVRLNADGFAVVGKGFDNKEDEDLEVEHYETPYSLLSSISKEFTQSFGNSLMDRLKDLEQQ